MSKILKKPIFIFGSQKSGSSLLRSLLDAHHELFVIPSESHYFQLTGHYVDFSLRKSLPRKLARDQQISALKQYIHKENINDDPHGAVMIENKYNEEHFSRYLESQPIEDEPELMSAYLSAYYNALHDTDMPPDLRVVEKSVEHAEFAPLINKWFPDAKFIHIVRNPYATLVACRNTDWQRGYAYLGPYLYSMESSYCQLFKNLELFNNYLVVRYEDLVSDPQKTMSLIANHLGIQNHASLQTPTLCGNLWGGNSSSKQIFSNIASTPSTKWLDSICDLEIILTNKVSRPIFDYFNYELLSPKHHYLRQRFVPVQGESAKQYLRNRALLWSL